MTPTHYIGHRLPRMQSMARRIRARMLMGELLVALGKPGHSRSCVCGPAFTSAELDGLAMVQWRIGRGIGGPQDGGA